MKRICMVALLAVFLLAGCTQTGWVSENGHTSYYDDQGLALTGWQNIEGKWFYFDHAGQLQTGWLELGEGRCYLNEQGNPITGWQTLEGKTYLLREKGFVTTGWQNTDRGRRYFHEDGTMATGRLELEEGTYFLDETGAALTGWQTTEDGRRYLDDQGRGVQGLTRMPEGLYCFSEGIYATGWVEEAGNTYFFDENGTAATGWREYGQYRRYFDSDGVMAVGPKIIDEVQYYFTPKGYELLLTNKDNPLPEEFPLDIVKVGPNCYMDSQVAQDYERMLSDLKAAGLGVGVTSSYRNFIDQRGAFNRKVMEFMDMGYSYEDAQKEAQTRVSRPGTSEHQTGLAVDLEGWDGLMWLKEHCWEYGFIVRYPGGKSHIPGVIYEPWHFRYVGVEIAMDMKDTGLCLEEYLQAGEADLPET